MRITLEKRRTPSGVTSLLVGIGAVLLALAISAIVLKVMGFDPFHVFGTAYSKTYFTKDGILENIVTFVPLSLCALSVAIAAKAGLWNIGVEGQFYVGALSATGIALALPNAPWFVVMPAMMIGGAVAAGLFCYLAVLPKIYLGISEILTTILLNSVVLYFVRWIVYSSSWKDTTTIAAQTWNISQAARLPILIGGSRVHAGVVIAAVIIISVSFYLNRTVSGFQLKMVGANARGAKYSGINIKKVFFIAMLLSGIMAGMAGALEISGVTYRLQATISSDYGFTAFAIAWVARLNVYAIAFLSYFFSGILVAGYKMQMMSLPFAVTTMMQGLILVLVLGGEFLSIYKVRFIKGSKEQELKPIAKQEELTSSDQA